MQCYGRSDSFVEKIRWPLYNVVVKHVDRKVVRRDETTGALVYSTDYTNTYYHLSTDKVLLKQKWFRTLLVF